MSCGKWRNLERGWLSIRRKNSLIDAVSHCRMANEEISSLVVVLGPQATCGRPGRSASRGRRDQSDGARNAPGSLRRGPESGDELASVAMRNAAVRSFRRRPHPIRHSMFRIGGISPTRILANFRATGIARRCRNSRRTPHVARDYAKMRGDCLRAHPAGIPAEHPSAVARLRRASFGQWVQAPFRSVAKFSPYPRGRMFGRRFLGSRTNASMSCALA